MATQTFLDEARRLDQAMVALVKVYLTSPTTRTLYLGPSDLDTPDNQTWEPVIVDYDPIKAPSDFLGPGPDLCTAGFTLAARATLGFQASTTKNLTDLFYEFRWIGAKVEVYLWPFRLTDFANVQLAFTGIVASYQVGPDKIEVGCTQRNDWNKVFSSSIVTRDKYPRAPDRSDGLPLPVVYGDVSVPMRSPITNTYRRDFERVHGGYLGVPALTVDTGRGGSNQKQKVLIASHAVKDHSNTSTGFTYYMLQNDILVPITPSALVNAAAGSGFELADDFAVALYPVRAIDTSTLGTGGKNPRYAMDGDETTFCKMVSNVGPNRQLWRMEAVNPPGKLVEIFSIWAYRSSAALTNFEFRVHKNGSPVGTPVAVSASTTFTVTRLSMGTAWGGTITPNNPWDFSEIELEGWWPSSPGGTEEFYLYFIGIEVQYRPKAKVYAAGFRQPPRLRVRSSGGALDAAFEAMSFATAPDTEIESEFYGTFQGVADDGSGTYTGVASALIERAPDIAHHLLRTYAGQTSGQVVTAGSTFGSLVDARAAMKTWNGKDWPCGLQQAEESSIGQALETLAKSSLSQVYLDRFTDKWHWIPWKQGAGTDYARKVYRDDLIDFHCESIQANRVPSGVRISYGYDGKTKRTSFQTHCSTVSSSSGRDYFNVRDEYLTVTASVNDKLDITIGDNGAGGVATNYTATLTAGTFADLHALAADVKTQLNAIQGGLNAFKAQVVHQNRIVTGYNDTIDFNDGAAKTATIAAGTYTCETLATAVAAALNAVSSNWTCTYSRTTRKFTIDRTSGTKTLTAQSTTASLAMTNLGYRANGAGTAGDFEVEEDRLILQSIVNSGSMFDLLWQNGTNGTEAAAPKTCADLLGFDGRQDRTVATRHMSDSPKGPREKSLADAGAAYGFTRPLAREASAIYSTDSARELRNRLIDWLKEPRVIVRFVTSRMPDVRRGELVRFDDLDEFGVRFPKQGSNGLWTGKRFRVLTVWQYVGDKFDQEIECIEND